MGYIRIVLRGGNLIFSLGSQWLYLKKKTCNIFIQKVGRAYAIFNSKLTALVCVSTSHTLCVCVLVAKSCPTLCDRMNCSSPGSSVHGILQARILEQVAILLGIFPTQGSNSGFLDYRQILYHLSHHKCVARVPDLHFLM